MLGVVASFFLGPYGRLPPSLSPLQVLFPVGAYPDPLARPPQASKRYHVILERFSTDRFRSSFLRNLLAPKRRDDFGAGRMEQPVMAWTAQYRADTLTFPTRRFSLVRPQKGRWR